MKKRKTRIENDSLGTRLVPAEAYYGIETLRAVENFPISAIRLRSSQRRSRGVVDGRPRSEAVPLPQRTSIRNGPACLPA